MNRMALIWAAAICTALLSTGAGGMLLHTARVARRTTMDRLASTTGPYRPTATQAKRRARVASASSASLIQRIERLFGFEREKRSKNSARFMRVIAVTAGCAAVGAILMDKAFGAAAAILFGVGLWVTLSRLFYGRLERRYGAALFRQFPDALGMIVRAVRVGVPLNGAIRLVADESSHPTSWEFRQLSEEIAIGRPIGDSLRSMAQRNNLPEYRFFATALSLQSQTGGGLSETLETLADTIRKRVAARLRGHALASEARTSCYVLGILPFVIGALLFVSNPSYMSVLFTTTPGLELLAVAGGSLSAGLYVMHVITKATLGG